MAPSIWNSKTGLGGGSDGAEAGSSSAPDQGGAGRPRMMAGWPAQARAHRPAPHLNLQACQRGDCQQLGRRLPHRVPALLIAQPLEGGQQGQAGPQRLLLPLPRPHVRQGQRGELARAGGARRQRAHGDSRRRGAAREHAQLKGLQLLQAWQPCQLQPAAALHSLHTQLQLLQRRQGFRHTGQQPRQHAVPSQAEPAEGQARQLGNQQLGGRPGGHCGREGGAAR